MKSLPSRDAVLCGAFAFGVDGTKTTTFAFDESKYCPGSPAWKHAQCVMSVTFPSNTCDEVSGEMLSRITSQSWVDPHNAGEYTIRDKGQSNVDEEISFIRGERTTGDKKYTDKFMLTFDPTLGPASCKVMACSQSQVFSILDFSTNYCNLRNLYCSTKEGCPVETFDFFDYAEEYVKCGQHDDGKCIVLISSQ